MASVPNSPPPKGLTLTHTQYSKSSRSAHHIHSIRAAMSRDGGREDVADIFFNIKGV